MLTFQGIRKEGKPPYIINSYVCKYCYTFSAFPRKIRGFKAFKYAPQDSPRMLIERSQGTQTIYIYSPIESEIH